MVMVAQKCDYTSAIAPCTSNWLKQSSAKASRQLNKTTGGRSALSLMKDGVK